MKTIKVIIKESNANPYTKSISSGIENLQNFFVGNVALKTYKIFLWEMWKLAVG